MHADIEEMITYEWLMLDSTILEGTKYLMYSVTVLDGAFFFLFNIMNSLLSELTLKSSSKHPKSQLHGMIFFLF